MAGAVLAAAAPASAAGPGALDTSFSGDGFAGLSPSTRLNGVAVAPAGSIYAAGQTTGAAPRILLTRLSANGAIDGGFPKLGPNPPLGAAIGNAVAVQADGRVLVAGSAAGTGAGGMVLERFNADGTVDSSFGGGDGVADVAFGSLAGQGNAVAVQRDGKIVVAGSAQGRDGYTRVAVARYNANGTLDGSFGFAGLTLAQLTPGTECTVPGRTVDCLRQSTGQGVGVQSDGKIVVAGYSQFNLQTRDGVVVRFNSNGSLDGSYSGDGVARVGAGTFGGANVEFRALVLQSDNKAVVTGGAATAPNAANISAVTPIARFTTGGGLDGSFSGDGLASFPAARAAVSSTDARAGAFGIGRAKDGRIVAAGSFFDSGLNELALYAVNAGGNAETSFGAGGAAITRLPGTLSGVGNALAVGLDGNPVVAGEAASLTASDKPAGLVARYGGFGRIGVPPPPPVANPKNVQITFPRGRLSVSRKGRVTFTIINRGKVGPVTSSIVVASKSKIRLSKRSRKIVTFAKAKLTIPAKAKRTVTLKLNRGNLALLRRLKRVTVQVTFTNTAKGAKKAVIKKTTRLEAPATKKKR